MDSIRSTVLTFHFPKGMNVFCQTKLFMCNLSEYQISKVHPAITKPLTYFPQNAGANFSCVASLIAI
jgi:hypothetical protein